MTHWEIGKAIEECGKALAEMPFSVLKNAEEDLESKYKRMEKIVEQVQEFVQEKIKVLNELDAKHAEECERITRDIVNRREALSRAINSIDHWQLSRVTELTKAIEALRRINPEDLDLLVKVLGGGK